MKGPTRTQLAEPIGAATPPFDAPIAAPAGAEDDVSDLRAIYRQHARFVWLSLQRLGVYPADLDDVAQDVFIIVHRRLDTFDRRAQVTTWLFGICMRVAANYRRRRRWTRELLSGWTEDERPALLLAADDVLVRREERESAERALDRLDVAKRAIFVMFEIESLSCLEIAELMSVPVGTVYSRLHGARRQLAKTIARDLKRRQLPDPPAGRLHAEPALGRT
jgi:RNA polymerase sigma-70 factor (ECF subfamily)